MTHDIDLARKIQSCGNRVLRWSSKPTEKVACRRRIGHSGSHKWWNRSGAFMNWETDSDGRIQVEEGDSDVVIEYGVLLKQTGSV